MPSCRICACCLKQSASSMTCRTCVSPASALLSQELRHHSAFYTPGGDRNFLPVFSATTKTTPNMPLRYYYCSITDADQRAATKKDSCEFGTNRSEQLTILCVCVSTYPSSPKHTPRSRSRTKGTFEKNKRTAIVDINTIR